MHLSHGNLQSAADVLIRAADRASGADAKLTAELLIAAKRPEEAIQLAVRIASEQADAWPWLGQFAGHMRERGDIAASQRSLAAFVAAKPASASACLQADMALALGLPAGFRSSEELEEIHRSYLRRLDDFVAKHPPEVLKEMQVRPDDLKWSNFHLAYLGRDDMAAQSAFGDWLVTSLDAINPLPAPQTTRQQPSIAVVSDRLHECTVGWYFAEWFEYLAEHGWHVTLVHAPGSRRDGLTQRMAARCQGEVTLPNNLAQAAARILALGAGIVLYPELGMDAFTFALAAHRLAPIQVCAWGHPVTTGLATIDAYLTCAEMEPENAAQHYRERLIGLPGIGTKYTSPQLPTDTTRQRLGLPAERPLYLVPQALFKLHPDSDRLLVEIVRRDPAALFVLFELRPPSSARIVNDRLLKALAAVSSHPETHIQWGPECSRADYLRVNQVCDVMIDTPHWSGGNASLDALHCGLPIVTIPGQFMRGRQSAAMLRQLGCDELIATSAEELAEIAVACAHDPARRNNLSDRIRAGLPSLTQSERPLQVMEAALRGLLVAGGVPVH